MLWIIPFKRYFEFSGRSGRAEYWHFIGVVFAAYVVSALVGGGGDIARGALPPLAIVVMLGCFAPAYAVTFRRLHDRNHSGWLVGVIWILNGVLLTIDRLRDGTRGSFIDLPLMLINGIVAVGALVLAIYVLVQLSSPGDATANRYGAPPRVVDLPATNLSQTVGSFAETARSMFAKPPEADPIEQLARLAKLRQEGVLTEAEFEEHKAALLKRSGS